MVNYKCKKCNKIFNKKSNFVRHINRKFSCIPEENIYLSNGDRYSESIEKSIYTDKYSDEDKYLSKDDHNRITERSKKVSKKISEGSKKISEGSKRAKKDQNEINQKKRFQCPNCNKFFTKKTNFYRHKKHFCKGSDKNISESSEEESVEILQKKVKEAEKKVEVELLKKKLAEAEKKIDELKMTQTVTNINIFAYDKNPDMSHLTNHDFLKIMNRGVNSVPKLIEAIHFNPDKPENHNVYIPNLKNKYAMIYNGKKWDLSNKEDIIDDMYDDNSNILEEKMEELENSEKNSKVLNKFKRFINKKEDERIRNKVKDQIKLLLFNNKEVLKQIK